MRICVWASNGSIDMHILPDVKWCSHMFSHNCTSVYLGITLHVYIHMHWHIYVDSQRVTAAHDVYLAGDGHVVEGARHEDPEEVAVRRGADLVRRRHVLPAELPLLGSARWGRGGDGESVARRESKAAGGRGGGRER